MSARNNHGNERWANGKHMNGSGRRAICNHKHGKLGSEKGKHNNGKHKNWKRSNGNHTKGTHEIKKNMERRKSRRNHADGNVKLSRRFCLCPIAELT